MLELKTPMTKFRTLMLAFILCVPGAAQTLYGTTAGPSSAGSLYTINTATGAATLVGALRDAGSNAYAISAMAVHPNGTVYGFTSTRSATRPQALVTINLSTAVVTPVGNTQTNVIADMTILPSGQAFGWAEPVADDLVSINLTTGAATVVANSGLNTYGSGLAANAAGTVYLTGSGING